VGCFVVLTIWSVGGLFCCAHDMVCRWAVLLCSLYGLSVGCFVVLTIWSVGGLFCCAHDMVCRWAVLKAVISLGVP